MINRSVCIVVALLVLLAGCSAGTPEIVRRADDYASRGQLETAVTMLRTEVQQRPNDIAVRLRYQRYLGQLLAALNKEGDQERAAGDAGMARNLYQRALAWDPQNANARNGLKLLDQDARHRQEIATARQLAESHPDQAMAMVTRILAENPTQGDALQLRDDLETHKLAQSTDLSTLASNLRRPISVSFREEPLVSVMELIRQLSGLNFIFDKDVPINPPVTISATDTSIENVLKMVFGANQLTYKVINAKTILIYPKRPDKDAEYRELTMRVFYLSYADPLQVLAMLKQMVRTRDVYVDERLHAVIMRDAPETLDVAERLVHAMDLPPAEVTLEVEALEVSTTDIANLGLKYPESVSLTVAPQRGNTIQAQGSGNLTLADLWNINKSDILVNFGSPTMTIDMLQRMGKTHMLANPRIRVVNRQKAQVLIGDRVPVVTTTQTSGFSSESVNYENVGLSLKLQPTISLDGEVNVDVSVEVSNVVRTVTTHTGLVAYQIGTRTAETNMTVHDGESQVLGGLLLRNEANSSVGLPGLSRIPLLGHLFGTRGNDNKGTELVLVITPHIERGLLLPGSRSTVFDSGTDIRISSQPSIALPSNATINFPQGQAGEVVITPNVPRPAAPPPATPPAPAAASSAPGK
jgi:general secretion pathway protein D